MGEEAGIKSATITITGQYAYGYLKGEAGVHRLVRISPYDAGKRRHTSFAAVLVFPEVEDDIDIELKDDDIKMDTFRASGAGGQHVNKTSSAVRLTHIPSGIIVSCQNERSQHKNKAIAMKILKARIYDLRLKEQEKKIEGFVADKKGIAWGSQIRSYILQPYRIIKDHRTDIETGNVDAVLEGDIDNFIKASLQKK
jgi:peptide chain release factor 2